ncbi:hypothetical protein Acr_00g0080270 [Actinidia rufa]|uniref:Uncharacterized protein n=1 Tax=Actinidia rufa TaxID=165716 RepID=A0A7J0DU58_9ERIC|nr:hypothetical protein Acr_00g0080270 [Actinidia rufa]
MGNDSEDNEVLAGEGQEPDDEDISLEDMESQDGQLAKFMASLEKRPRTPPRRPEFILPPLNAPVAQVLSEIKHEEFVKWPRKIKTDPQKRNRKKYCEFLRDHGHNTEDYFQLKEQIADLIKRGYLRKYITDRPPPNSPERRYGDNRPIAGNIQTIHGGFGSGGCSTSSRKKHARSAFRSVEEKVYNLSSPCVGDQPPITFSSDDLRGLHLPHDDALVISAVIANFNVQRILIDSGSSADILFISAFEKMKIGLDKLHPFHTPLIGFGGKYNATPGMDQFTNNPGNRTTPDHRIKAITFTYHLKMKFPTLTGIGEKAGDDAGILRGEMEQLILEDPRETENTKPLEEVVPISIHPNYPDRQVMIGTELTDELRIALIDFLKKNSDVFAWSQGDVPGIDPEIAMHKLFTKPEYSPVRQKRRKFAPERLKVIEDEVNKLIKILGNARAATKLPTLSEVNAERTEAIFGKIEPGGYFEVSKVLGSRTFNRHFAVGCTALSTSGGENATSGDEGEFVTREDSVEYLRVIRRDIGGVIRKAHPGIPDETLLRWLGGKVKDPFTNLLSGTSGSSSDSGSISISDSELPPELRSDAMSARGKAKAEKATKMTAKPPTKGVVIREKRTREGNPLIEIGEPDSSKGKEAVPPPPPKRFKSNRGAINAKGRAGGAGTSSPGGDMGSESMSDASVARRLLIGVILASDKKEVDQLSENELVAKSFHALGQLRLKIELSRRRIGWPSLARRDQKPGSEVDDLKATVAELTNKLAKAKELAIEDFKASGEFKAAVIDSAATYFSEGFELCKRQLLHQFPNLGVDVANMAMDPSFAEEEEARKEGEDPAAGVAPDV